METFIIKRNDTSPALSVTLQDNNGTPIDVTGSSIKFHMTKIGSLTTKVNAAATIINALTGQVRYTWLAIDTDAEGLFRAEFEVTYSDSTIETFPNNDSIIINIVNEIA